MSYHVENPCCPCCEEQEVYRAVLLSALAILRNDKTNIAQVVAADIRKALKLPDAADRINARVGGWIGHD